MFSFYRVIMKVESGPDHGAFDIVDELGKTPDPSTWVLPVVKRMFILALSLQFFPQ